MEEYQPYTVADPIRDEHAHMYIPKLRMVTSVPLCQGEEWGNDFYKLVETETSITSARHCPTWAASRKW
jgi:hypothetical protein